LGFQLDKTHVRGCRRLGDALGVAIVVLLGLPIRLHIFRRHQADIMSLVREQATKVMRAAARLHGDVAGRQLRGEPDQRLPL
jgi:hypothetical protein